MCISMSAIIEGGAQVPGGRVWMMELSCYKMWQSGSIIEDHHLSASALSTMIHHLSDTEGHRFSALNSLKHQHQLFPESTSQQPYCPDFLSVREAVGQSVVLVFTETDTHGLDQRYHYQ